MIERYEVRFKNPPHKDKVWATWSANELTHAIASAKNCKRKLGRETELVEISSRPIEFGTKEAQGE